MIYCTKDIMQFGTTLYSGINISLKHKDVLVLAYLNTNTLGVLIFAGTNFAILAKHDRQKTKNFP